MKSVFGFDFVSPSRAGQPRRHTVFFFGKHGLNVSDCYRAIDAHYSRHPISDDVTFLGFQGDEKVFRAALAEQRVVSRIRQAAVGKASARPRVLLVGHEGITELTGTNYEQSISADTGLCATIQHEGANWIFRNHHGMLEASESHHYVKPSLRHTDRFIRSGSVLVNGVEIDFLCIWLLPLLTQNIKHVYTDSSTINSIAYALVLLRNRLAPEAERVFPTIQSFESYKGLNPDTFADRAHSLVLVSASSGGAMMQDLVGKHRIDSNRLCTLFYLGESLPVGRILCNLTRSEHNPQGYLPAIVTKSGDRGPFPIHSLPVHILAEAFVPENPAVEAVQVSLDDIPKWWNSFKHSFVGRECVRCFSPDPAEVDMSKPPKHPVAIDVNQALRFSTPFSSKLKQILMTAVPATLETIIGFEDAGSKSMVVRLRKVLRQRTTRPKGVRGIAAAQYAGRNGEGFGVEVNDLSSCCVVCSILADGTRLLDIAQILRNRQRNHAIAFIVGLVASPSEKDLREFKSNLCYSQSGVPYAFHAVESIELPRVFRGEPTPWHEELRFWTEQLQDMPPKKRANLSRIVESRVVELQNPDGGRGFVHAAFLAGAMPPLKLRPNSVFTEGLSPDLPFSQADMFLAATAVLHNMRTRKVGAGRLEQHPHKRTVVSPTLFYRFSDGVIQAAFLRAATSTELDYRMDRSMSKLMGDVLIGIFQKPDSQRAEALTEMLYAIACGKLRLLREDLNAFLTRIEPRLAQKPKFELETLLCRIIRKKFLNAAPKSNRPGS